MSHERARKVRLRRYSGLPPDASVLPHPSETAGLHPFSPPAGIDSHSPAPQVLRPKRLARVVLGDPLPLPYAVDTTVRGSRRVSVEFSPSLDALPEPVRTSVFHKEFLTDTTPAPPPLRHGDCQSERRAQRTVSAPGALTEPIHEPPLVTSKDKTRDLISQYLAHKQATALRVPSTRGSLELASNRLLTSNPLLTSNRLLTRGTLRHRRPVVELSPNTDATSLRRQLVGEVSPSFHSTPPRLETVTPPPDHSHATQPIQRNPTQSSAARILASLSPDATEAEVRALLLKILEPTVEQNLRLRASIPAVSPGVPLPTPPPVTPEISKSHNQWICDRVQALRGVAATAVLPRWNLPYLPVTPQWITSKRVGAVVIMVSLWLLLSYSLASVNWFYCYWDC